MKRIARFWLNASTKVGKRPRLAKIFLAGVGALLALEAQADRVAVAVASNFRPALQALEQTFTSQTGHALVVSYGATGKLYAQIMNGAPFAVFLAADADRPARLEADGKAIAGTRFTYAIGQLVLWSRQPGRGDIGPDLLKDGSFSHLAIANPETAPYGLAARQTLERMGLWQALSPRVVRGENIGQAYAFVRSGNAALGFIAQSQLSAAPLEPPGSFWVVPGDLHDPIEQQAILLSGQAAARAFLDFLGGEEARAMIESHGYRVAQ